MRKWIWIGLLASAFSPPVQSQSLPVGFSVENVASDEFFVVPTALAFAQDGRIFVTEKGGFVYIVENGVKLATPFIDISDLVMHHGDRGLLGIALDPNFSNNGYVYLAYTWDFDGGGDIEREDIPGRLVRYRADTTNPNIADLSSERILIGQAYAEGFPCCHWSHSLGSLRWGTDGTLLVGAGDGASFFVVDEGGLYPDCFGRDRFHRRQDVGAFRAQYLSSYSGKILRIDPATGNGLSSNPFYNGMPGDIISKVWAYGMRNPFRFYVRDNGSSNPNDGQPGTLYIGDVGWNKTEELNIARNGGENFGWPCYEGPGEQPLYQAANPMHSDCSTVGAVDSPTLYWDHVNPDLSFPPGLIARAINGASFYYGTKYPLEYQGKAFYGDYTEQWLAYGEFDENDNFLSQKVFTNELGPLVEIIYDPYSEYLYYIDIWAGAVNRIVYDDGGSPIPCSEVTQIRAKCRENEWMKIQVVLATSDYDGEEIEITIDGTDVYTGIVSGDRARIQAPGIYAAGDHTVELTDPAGCLSPIAVSCTAAPDMAQSDMEDDAWWASEATTVEPQPSSALTGVYPNPFNPTTTISYRLSRDGPVSIRVYNMLGQEVATLVDEFQQAGQHSVQWDGRNEVGETLGSGLYVTRFVAGRVVLVEKMMLIK